MKVQMAITQQEIEKFITAPNVVDRIDRIINNPRPQLLESMVYFAEWLERKHKQGYVVYWTTAGEPRFEVDLAESYYRSLDAGHSWVGPVHWHTSLCDT